MAPYPHHTSHGADGRRAVTLPLGLVSAIESGECVLFVGSGLGHNMLRPDGTHLPDGEQLAASMAERFQIDAGEHADLAQVAQVVELRHDRARLISHIERELSGFEPDENMRWLASLTWRAIFTTNYDRGIERAYELTANPTQSPVVIGTNSELQAWDPRFEVPVFHLHGSLQSSEAKQSILITEQDYATFRARRQMLFDHLRVSYSTTPILYVGYSHRDANWRMITAELRAEFEPNKPPASYRLAPSTPALHREILDAQGVTTVDGNLGDLRALIQARLGDIRVEPASLDALERAIPTELRELFAQSPVAVTRLLNSWDYVNQADFIATPNTEAFLKGDRASWSLIGRGINFERDIEQPLVDQLTEFATDPSPRVTTQIILGSAGYGMTTLLMAVAAWFVQNKVGTTLFLKQGASPIPADIEFAARYFPPPIVFCVDNAADHEWQVNEAQRQLAALDIPAFLLLAERLNEWRQCRPSLRSREIIIDPLSDDEIERLLAALGHVNALGKLADLSPQLQFATIKVKNQQQLLVTMREATEGRAFDAIIEDEFRNIQHAAARELYALVCSFSRVRALVRDSVCADALGMPTLNLYDLINRNLEGIVEWEEVDPARGIEALRARHQIIADIVWHRCMGASEHERALLKSVDALNLTFGADAKAFEVFTRDSEAVDSLGTLEAKTRFFERACRKDPLNGFVRQHYARMLLRERRLELALGQVDRAVELAPRARVIRHTRGVVLRELALEAASPEVARRRLAQSEDAFEGALQQNPRDEYSYQSLAELYLEWAQKSADDAESVDYLNRAESVVLRGLQRVRQREGLYLVRARIEQEVGDEPARLVALQQALKAAPNNSIVRYVLGTALRRRGDYDEAIQVLHAGLTDQPDDPYLALALSLAYHESGREYAECVAVLYIARMKGERDPEFIATYGGMLVMSDQLGDAEEVWLRASEHNFTFTDANRLAFRPHPGNEEVRLPGRVSAVRAGFAFVASPGLPNFFWPGRRFGDTRPRVGDVVEFQPGFSARGPVVADVCAPDVAQRLPVS